MMATLVLKLTDAGLAAVQAASGSDPTVIAQLGLTATQFDYAPTLTALPGEFKRIDVASGIATAPNITHLTAYDTSADVWTIMGFGLFLADGTLFAVHTGSEPVMSKVGLAFALLAFDIAFEADFAASISYGNAVFAYPAATEAIPGISEIATQDEVDAGVDGRRLVTPKTLRQRLQALVDTISQAISNFGLSLNEEAQARADADNTLRNRSITGGGLVSGGGNLGADFSLTVSEASAEQIVEGTSDDTVVTPRRLGPITMLLEENGFIRFFGFQINWGRFMASANGTTVVPFVRSFNTACFSAVISGTTPDSNDSQDNAPEVIASSINPNGFSAFSADDSANPTCYIAVGS